MAVAIRRPRTPSYPARVLPVAVAVASTVLLLLNWLRQSDLGLSTFVIAGDEWVDPLEKPEELLLWRDTVGYDGRFFYRLAIEPFTDEVDAYGIPLDKPAYRQRRILYPLLVHLLTRLTGVSALVWLVVINIAAVALTTWLAIRLCQRYDRSVWWSLLFGLSPAMYVGVTRDMAEPLALTMAAAGLLAIVDSRWVLASATLTLAALTRETTLVIAAGVGLQAAFMLLRERKRVWLTPAIAMLAPLVTLLLWELWLRANWPGQGLESDVERQLTVPWLQTLQYLVSPVDTTLLTADEMRQALWLLERLLLLGILVAGALLLRGSSVPSGLKWSWILAFILAGGTVWLWDGQFIRATAEAVLLTQLVALAHPSPRSRLVLESTGLLTLMVVISS